MDIKQLFAYYASLKQILVAKRPWAHHSKAGPGRKHQQTKTLTKKQREELKEIKLKRLMKEHNV